jgi:hypothetical protein
MAFEEHRRRKRRARHWISTLAVIFVCAMLWSPVRAEESKKEVTNGKLLGTIDPATYVQKSLIFSPDGRHAIWLKQSKDRHQLLLDGVPGPLFEGKLRPPAVLSPDGRRVAYLVENEKDQLQQIITDDTFGPVFDKIFTGPIFSPDSRRTAYAGVLKGKYQVLLDGVPGPKYELVGHLMFSPDSRRFAYAAQKNKKRFVVVDGVSGPPFDDVYPSGFSPDSRHLVYYATQGKKHRVMVDGHPGPEYDSIGPVRFNPVRVNEDPTIGYIGVLGRKLIEVTQSMP